MLHLSGDAAEVDLSGNFAENVSIWVEGGSESVFVRDNEVGELPLLAPSTPVFLADGQHPSTTPGTGGISFDGIPIDADSVPGAFQARDAKALPRPNEVTLGNQNCSPSPCDIDYGDGDIQTGPGQRAVWFTWPGGTLEVFPGQYGGLVLSWPVAIRGNGSLASPNTRSTFSGPGLEVFRDFGWGWRGGRAVHILRDVAPVDIANIDISGGQVAIDVESDTDGGAEGPTVTLQRLRVVSESTSASTGLVSNRRLSVSNTLLSGTWNKCIKAGASSDLVAANLTCHLVGATDFAGALDVGNALRAVFVNSIVASEVPGPLFTIGQEPPPTILQVDGLSHRGLTTTYEGFSPPHPDDIQNMVEIANDDPLFDDENGQLDPASPVIDSGVAPQVNGTTVELEPSLYGVARDGRLVDRGCHEQGS